MSLSSSLLWRGLLAASLATVFGLFSIIYGLSAVVLSIQARNAASTARRLLTPST